MDEVIKLTGVEKVRHHLTEARRIMYDEHWLSVEIDRFLALDRIKDQSHGL